MRILAYAILVAVTLAGCGLKGPLYLPQNPPAPQPDKPAQQSGAQTK